MEYTGNIILKDEILYGGKIVIKNGIICDIIPNAVKRDIRLPYIAPGFVDIHNHGAMGFDYMESTDEAFLEIGKYLVSHGVTSSQCTMVSATKEDIRAFLSKYRMWHNREDIDITRYIGVHIEGPYISEKACGAHKKDTLRVPSRDGYDIILENSDVIREITVAPELDGMKNMICEMKKAGIVISGGHDNAEPEHIDIAYQSGMSHCTHIYCAMSTLHKSGFHRKHGLSEFSLINDGMTCEIIGDNHHTPPVLAKIIYKMKSADKLCLVSDAISPSGLLEPDKVYCLGCGESATKVIVDDGVAMLEDKSVYAGSIQPLDMMIKNMVYDCDIPLFDAVRMASLTPASVLGLNEEIGSIEKGKKADLCFLDDKLNVTKTLITGRVVFERGGFENGKDN